MSCLKTTFLYFDQFCGGVGLLEPSSKICTLVTNPRVRVSMDSPWPQQSVFGDSDPWGLILGPRGFWNQIIKSANLSQTPTIWVPMDLPGPHQLFMGYCGPRGQILGPRALWPQNSKICNFLTKPHNMDVYRLTWTPAFIFEVIWTLGPNFGSKGPLAPN